ncbi:hypothetical protein [Botrimarina hoheduenensis]|uniref:TIGR03009 domain-containing protein n=1 Tax=Botrimarina hoheduenensis TaxID=2528000 RepID=A0A5C5WA57_9BACT|nr:hypothetical protein [Botrimarina hoheduenensis]TWT46921.1 hypothetical protein Pla111_20230 [Botrimarina hoheduenensis]
MPDRLRQAALLAALLLAPLVSAQQPMPPAGMAPQAPQGFALSPAEEAYLDQVLTAWELESKKIQTFSCGFTRIVYDHVFGPAPDPETGVRIHVREEDGELSYQRPDKGRFEITKVRAWDAAQQQHVENANIIGEKWVCDGEAVYEYATEQKQLKVRPIPKEMQGESIVDGPLPFLFGAEAEKLKRRYWLKLDPRAPAGQLWLVALPKYHQDAANYSQVELMLDRQRLLPTAMRVQAPDGSQTVYTFAADKAEINATMARLWGQLFSAPRTPFGWKRVVEQAEPEQAANPSAAIR